jgi:hypothetical protein
MSKKEKVKKLDSHKKNTSLRLDAKTLKALKIIAIQNDTSVQQIVEQLITDFVQRSGIKELPPK